MTGVRVIQSSSSKETHIRILAQGSHIRLSDYHLQKCSIFPGSNVCIDSRGSDLALPVHLHRRVWRTPLFFSEATVCFGDYRGRGLVGCLERWIVGVGGCRASCPVGHFQVSGFLG